MICRNFLGGLNGMWEYVCLPRDTRFIILHAPDFAFGCALGYDVHAPAG